MNTLDNRWVMCALPELHYNVGPYVRLACGIRGTGIWSDKPEVMNVHLRCLICQVVVGFLDRNPSAVYQRGG